MEAWSSVNERRREEGDREHEGGQGGGWCYPPCPPIGPQVSGHREVEGRAADWHPPNSLIYRKLWGISSTCWFVNANKQLHEHTDNNMFVTLSPVSYGGNWSGCQKQRDQSLLGITVAVVLLSEIESITYEPIIIVVGAQALDLDEASLLTNRWGIPGCSEIRLIVYQNQELKALFALSAFHLTTPEILNLKFSRHFLFTAVLLIASMLIPNVCCLVAA